ncbi:MAG: hypothetical protein ACR2N3_10450 [Pyrinomonadaceae bacterium]
MDNFLLTNLIGQYKSDSESVYNTWFIGSEARMKAFRSIRRGVRDTVSLIDVIWLKKDTSEIVSAFEVEKSTSIYSGILRLEDLARSIPVENCACHFYLVAPSARAKEVVAQLARPAFRSTVADNSFAFITFDDLHAHCDALCRFGEDHRVLRKVVFSGSAAHQI